MIVFPDVTALAIEVIRTGLADHDQADVTVAARVPGDRTLGAGRLVTVRPVGGDTYSVVFHAAQLRFDAWDDDEAGAHDLAQLAAAILRATAGRVVDGTPVYRVEIAGPAFDPDPESEQPRFSATATVVVRGQTA